jgi:phosphatidylserine decarboxylase
VSNWQLAVMKTLPLRFLSRIWGYVHSIDLPLWMREPVYMAWTVAFGCELSEAEHPLIYHKNLASFFTRSLKPGARPIDTTASMVSPADAEITVFGEVTPEGRLDQIKGMSYELKEFLGFTPPLAGPLINPASSSQTGSKMYFAVLYLAPGDYHRFHSSADWKITHRAHFAGQLFPVKPSLATFIPSLFTRNERIVLSGEWEHGFYSYTAVGAYNVGSMKLDFDPELKTNLGNAKLRRGLAGDGDVKEYSPPISATKGDTIGRFELGSTVVLVWEVKDGDFVFTFDEKNRKIRYGMPLGIVKPRGAGVEAAAHHTTTSHQTLPVSDP